MQAHSKTPADGTIAVSHKLLLTILTSIIMINFDLSFVGGLFFLSFNFVEISIKAI